MNHRYKSVKVVAVKRNPYGIDSYASRSTLTTYDLNSAMDHVISSRDIITSKLFILGVAIAPFVGAFLLGSILMAIRFDNTPSGEIPSVEYLKSYVLGWVASLFLISFLLYMAALESAIPRIVCRDRGITVEKGSDTAKLMAERGIEWAQGIKVVKSSKWNGFVESLRR